MLEQYLIILENKMDWSCATSVLSVTVRPTVYIYLCYNVHRAWHSQEYMYILHVHVQVEKDHTTTPHPPTGYYYNNAELADTYMHAHVLST